MTFKTKCRNCINNTLKQIQKSKEHCVNFNELSINFWEEKGTNSKPKVIIVGTFTPYDGRKEGFFYMSKKNNQIFFINDELADIKNQIRDSNDVNRKKELINQILEKLFDKGIMLLDVVKASVKINMESAADDAIDEPFCLAKDDFRKYYDNQDIHFIFNSRNAEYAFKLMFNIRKNITDIENTRFHYQAQITRRKTKETLKTNWIKILTELGVA